MRNPLVPRRALACILGLGLALGVPSLNAQETAPAHPDSLPADRWIAPDKAAHVFGGYWAAGAGYAAASRLDADSGERRGAAIAAGLVAGVAKEAFDRLVQRERFSWKDLAADAAGILLLVAATAAAEP